MECLITSKIKGLLASKGKQQKDLAAYMGITQQSLRNKFSRGSFSADDLIKIADFTGSELSFVSDKDKITLGTDCLRNTDQ